jgi:hypothetical protein
MADALQISRLLEDETLQQMLERHRREGIDVCAMPWRKADILQRYSRESDQWGSEDKVSTERFRDWKSDPFKTKRISVNEIRQVVDAAAGRQVMQRFERAYRPRQSSAERFGEVVSAIDKAFMAQADVEQVDSAAFRDGPLTQGVSCVRWEYSTLEDPRGRIVITDWPIWQAMWGRDARQINLKDRSWHRIAWWMSAREVRERWPRKWKKVFSLAGSKPWANFENPQASSRTPWSGDIGNVVVGEPHGPAFYAAAEGAFWVEYEEWREIQVEFVVARPADPAMTYAAANAGSLEGQDLMIQETMTAREVTEFEEAHLAATGEEVPDMYVAPRKKVAYKYAYVIGTEIVETGDIPVGCFTVLFMTGARRTSPTGTKWIGLTENLIQSQMLNNMLLMALYKNLQINPKGVLFYEQGMFKTRKDALEQFTAPGGLIEVARGKLTSGAPPYRFEAGGTNAYSSMVESLFGFIRESIPRQAGFNPGALGQLGPDLRRISGQVVRQVQDAAIQSNAELFDAFRHYRREGGRLFLAFIGKFWGERLEELAEIVGEETLYTIDEETGLPVLSLPPAEMWRQDAWRMIDVQEIVPEDDRLDELWGILGDQGVFAVCQQPQYDTGTPIFSSTDIVHMLPKLRAAQREEMLRRKKKEIAEFLKQRQLAAAQQNQQPPTPAGGNSSELPVQ